MIRRDTTRGGADPAPVPPFACPRCREELWVGAPDEALSCPCCGRFYPVVRGVPNFTGGDPFYEGRWAEPDESAGSLRNWLVRKERFFLTGLRGVAGPILDLGCGGGWRLFTRFGEVAGVDLSQRSLERALTLYAAVARADLKALPFPDASFGAVVSSDVLGHIPLAEKDAVLAEIYRVLRPRGATLHYIEADSRDPLMKLAKRHPALYRQHVVAPEGHVGMETARATFARFRRAGFEPVREVAAYKLLMYPARVPQLFDNAYRAREPVLDELVRLVGPLGRDTGRAGQAANVVAAALIELGDRLLPRDWANGVLVKYRRPR